MIFQWVDVWIYGWMDVVAGLRIAYSNQKWLDGCGAWFCWKITEEELMVSKGKFFISLLPGLFPLFTFHSVGRCKERDSGWVTSQLAWANFFRLIMVNISERDCHIKSFLDGMHTFFRIIGPCCCIMQN